MKIKMKIKIKDKPRNVKSKIRNEILYGKEILLIKFNTKNNWITKLIWNQAQRIKQSKRNVRE